MTREQIALEIVISQYPASIPKESQELVIIEGGLPWWGDALYNHYTLTAMPGNLFGISGYFPYVLVEMSSFAKQVVLNDPPTNNSGTTTVEQAVCKSVKRVDLLLDVRQKQIDKSLEGFEELFEDSLYLSGTCGLSASHLHVREK